MILSELKQMVNVLGFCELILVGIFCMAVMEVTLAGEKDRRTRIWKWGIVILATALLSQLMTFGSGLLDIHFLAEKKESWGDDSVLSMVVNGIYLTWNTLKILLPMLMSYIGGIWLYRQERSVKAFDALLTGLGVILIYRYLYALLKIPFQRGCSDELAYAPPQTGLALLLLGICLSACFLLYWKAMCGRLQKLLDTPDGRMDGFVKVPFLSAVVFAGQLAVLYTFYLSPDSTDMGYRFIFIIVTGCLFFAYLLMYWSIFRGIMLSTEAMKNRAELGVATHIQANMLPCIFPAFPDRQEFDIYATMTPAKEVGGDFYDFFMVDDDHLAMVIADVSGKGVPAALFMVITKTLLKNCAQTGLSPSKVLEKVNNQLCENNEAEMFVTVWLGILTISSGCLTCANAGHEYPVIQHADGDYELMKDKHGFVLAGMEDSRYREYEWKLNPGDSLYVYTDGVVEATDKDDTLFGTDRMLKSLNSHKQAAPAELLPLIKNDIDAFVGDAPQFDDITMLNLRYKGAEVRT